jgi:hypothetical protein
MLVCLVVLRARQPAPLLPLAQTPGRVRLEHHSLRAASVALPVAPSQSASRELGFGSGPESGLRPVLRVRDAATQRLVKVFTRVRPDVHGTSIVIRIRDGWEEMRASLLPDALAARPNSLSPKQRCAGARGAGAASGVAHRGKGAASRRRLRSAVGPWGVLRGVPRRWTTHPGLPAAKEGGLPCVDPVGQSLASKRGEARALQRAAPCSGGPC